MKSENPNFIRSVAVTSVAVRRKVALVPDSLKKTLPNQNHSDHFSKRLSKKRNHPLKENSRKFEFIPLKFRSWTYDRSVVGFGRRTPKIWLTVFTPRMPHISNFKFMSTKKRIIYKTISSPNFRGMKMRQKLRPCIFRKPLGCEAGRVGWWKN